MNHRDDRYDGFQAVGDKATKGKPSTLGMFENYSLGLASGRDPWVVNYSAQRIALNVSSMIEHFNAQTAGDGAPVDLDPTKISWSDNFSQDLARGVVHKFDATRIVPIVYRPFSRQFCYFDRSVNTRVYQLPKLFPTPAHPNLVITAPGPGAAAGFFSLMYRVLPSLGAATGLQCFSLYTYEPVSAEAQGDLFSEPDSAVVDGYRRKDNITDATLTAYRGFYGDPAINKDDIFYYVYGLLQSPTYKETYKADLMKMFPRIPKVKDFWGFSTAGRSLADLHLNYETVPPAELTEVRRNEPPADIEAQYEYYRVQKLSWGARKDRSRIIYNSNITLEGIPAEVLDYQVNGKSAIEWIIDRYQVTTHKDSQITNDPNGYSREVGNPRYIVDLVKRIVTVSVETNKIVAGLPALEIVE